MSSPDLPGWDRLRHCGLLLDPARLREIAGHVPAPLDSYAERELRKRAADALDGAANVPDFVAFVLERICGFTADTGTWRRGSQVPARWSRRALTGERVRPRQLWQGQNGALLPVFLDTEKRVGVGRGRRTASQVLGWLRAGPERLALLTNGRQWRLLFAGLDFDAWCEWDLELWFEGGELSPQVTALRTLIQPALWTPPEQGAPPPLRQAIQDSRKGQAELSQVLGERVREAVELLIQSHGAVLKERCADVDPADIYRAACRVVMRLVVILFAEGRELLPRDNALYHSAYGLSALLEELEKGAARGGAGLKRSWSAWPRVLALFRLVYHGSHHPELPVPAYGGELFAPGDPKATDDGLARALAVFERACFEAELLPDCDVHRMLALLTRTRVKVRQGRTSTWVAAPVDFSDLSTEYIGILYEGLLDFELRTAPEGDPIIFLAVGDQPALPLSRLEQMDDRALRELFEKLKGRGRVSEGEAEEGEPEGAEPEEGEEEAEEAGGEVSEEIAEPGPSDAEVATDERRATRTRAELWARRAAQVAGLVKKPRGRKSPERRLAFEETLASKARRLVTRVVLPGEWYLVRWGGTRKGAGTFYTRPGLAVPTVQRTLRPLAHRPEEGGAKPGAGAPAARWLPKRPEEILALKVCDPACGSGTFLVAALRFLTDALYASLHHHGRIRDDGERAVVRLLEGHGAGDAGGELLCEELIPCRPDDDEFEPRLKAVLRRHVVERCIYGVDLDPLAVELCRLSLWIETMDRTLPFSFLDHKVKCGNSLVGAWFDTFQHYPAMAWKNREGGDKGHTNGVHYKAEARTKAIREFVKKVLTPDLRHFLEGRTLFQPDMTERACKAHDQALSVLERLHRLPIQDAAERARMYREELLGSDAYRALKEAMDLWCACWFWPADEIRCAPLPSTFADPPAETRRVAARLAAQHRFFHWELEFPDVFCEAGAGFDAVLGNPPWENLQPNPEEFFSNVDPLFRTQGRLRKLEVQRQIFADRRLEAQWLDYVGGFNSFSNWVANAADPFGDPERGSSAGFSIGRGGKGLHARWREDRRKSRGYAAAEHPFRYQTGRLFTYKLFLEQCHALLRSGGRLGQIVPSGIYSDAWSLPLRRLFLEHCRWEWLFGFENREKIFDIHRSFKFNPVIVEKGGHTQAILTAFMRRKIEDWERAEDIATPYTLRRVKRFSPKSLAILEIQSRRDLEILEKIYANSVLLGDDGPGGWGIEYKLEFMMNTDAELFPPRPWWEARGYRPDEYSRWLKGDWRPIEELWAELGVDPARPAPVEIELEEWLFDNTAGPDRREAEARFVHGHLLKPGDVARTEWRLRCAQPPYDRLPIPRADIPAGIILSRDGDAWIREDRIEDMALPLYEGRMIGQFDFSQKGWVSGKGRGAVWREIPWGRKQIEPQYLMRAADYASRILETRGGDGERSIDYAHVLKLTSAVSMIDVTSATNARTVFTAVVPAMPHGHSAPTLRCRAPQHLAAVMNSIVFDWATRLRQTGLHLVWAVLEELPLPPSGSAAPEPAWASGSGVAFTPPVMSARLLLYGAHHRPPVEGAAITSERSRTRAGLDAVIAVTFGLETDDLKHVLRFCDVPLDARAGARDPKGFWRVDKDKDPELRHTVLTLVAFHDLEEKIRAAGGDREKGIEAFLAQNHGEGWMLPERLRLTDYGLGHDERAKHPQPVASRLGPRFYDWQLTQTAEESWRECHLHARNLLGEAGYRKLLAEIEAERRGEPARIAAEETPSYDPHDPQGRLL